MVTATRRRAISIVDACDHAGPGSHEDEADTEGNASQPGGDDEGHCGTDDGEVEAEAVGATADVAAGAEEELGDDTDDDGEPDAGDEVTAADVPGGALVVVTHDGSPAVPHIDCTRNPVTPTHDGPSGSADAPGAHAVPTRRQKPATPPATDARRRPTPGHRPQRPRHNVISTRGRRFIRRRRSVTHWLKEFGTIAPILPGSVVTTGGPGPGNGCNRPGAVSRGEVARGQKVSGGDRKLCVERRVLVQCQ